MPPVENQPVKPNQKGAEFGLEPPQLYGFTGDRNPSPNPYQFTGDGQEVKSGPQIYLGPVGQDWGPRIGPSERRIDQMPPGPQKDAALARETNVLFNVPVALKAYRDDIKAADAIDQTDVARRNTANVALLKENQTQLAQAKAANASPEQMNSLLRKQEELQNAQKLIVGDYYAPATTRINAGLALITTGQDMLVDYGQNLISEALKLRPELRNNPAFNQNLEAARRECIKNREAAFTGEMRDPFQFTGDGSVPGGIPQKRPGIPGQPGRGPDGRPLPDGNPGFTPIPGYDAPPQQQVQPFPQFRRGGETPPHARNDRPNPVTTPELTPPAQRDNTKPQPSKNAETNEIIAITAIVGSLTMLGYRLYKRNGELVLEKDRDAVKSPEKIAQVKAEIEKLGKDYVTETRVKAEPRKDGLGPLEMEVTKPDGTKERISQEAFAERYKETGTKDVYLDTELRGVKAVELAKVPGFKEAMGLKTNDKIYAVIENGEVKLVKTSDFNANHREASPAESVQLKANEEKRVATEAKRVADEAEAKRVADAAEAKRVADEAEAKRVADAAEAKRVADAAEAKRVADEAEAKRVADEAEAKRVADEAEAKRVADAAEAKRVADEAEAKRVADEAEAKRVADAAAEAKRVADAAEAKRVADEAEAKRVADAAEAKRVADAAEAKRVADEAEAKRVADADEAKRVADAAEAKRVADAAEAASRFKPSAGAEVIPGLKVGDSVKVDGVNWTVAGKVEDRPTGTDKAEERINRVILKKEGGISRGKTPQQFEADKFNRVEIAGESGTYFQRKGTTSIYQYIPLEGFEANNAQAGKGFLFKLEGVEARPPLSPLVQAFFKPAAKPVEPTDGKPAAPADAAKPAKDVVAPHQVAAANALDRTIAEAQKYMAEKPNGTGGLFKFPEPLKLNFLDKSLTVSAVEVVDGKMYLKSATDGMRYSADMWLDVVKEGLAERAASTSIPAAEALAAKHSLEALSASPEARVALIKALASNFASETKAITPAAAEAVASASTPLRKGGTVSGTPAPGGVVASGGGADIRPTESGGYEVTGGKPEATELAAREVKGKEEIAKLRTDILENKEKTYTPEQQKRALQVLELADRGNVEAREAVRAATGRGGIDKATTVVTLGLVVTALSSWYAYEQMKSANSPYVGRAVVH